jgi:hypothetical protein
VQRALAVLVVVGCSPPAASPAPPVVRQIKSAPELAAPTAVAPYEVGSGEIRIDHRVIPVIGPTGRSDTIDAIAHDFARVPRQLRDLLQTLAISAVPSPNDAYFAAKYKLPVNAGMATGLHGDITIFPYGLAELRGELGERRARSTAEGSAQLDDGAMFVKNFMHELGHAWSRIAWASDASAKAAWLAAIASDPSAPSEYARISLRNSGAPDEDAAEATALYFLVLGTPAFDAYRAAMPKRFGLIAQRFAIIER